MTTKDYHDAANKLSIYVTGFQIANGSGAFSLTKSASVTYRRESALHFFNVMDNPTKNTRSEVCKMIGLIATSVLKGLMEKWRRQDKQTEQAFTKILRKYRK